MFSLAHILLDNSGMDANLLSRIKQDEDQYSSASPDSEGETNGYHSSCEYLCAEFVMVLYICLHSPLCVNLGS